MEYAQMWFDAFRDKSAWERLDQDLRLIEQGRFGVATELDADYPEVLREVEGRPTVLYYQGQWPLLQRTCIGIVGTRHPSPYGFSAARRLTQDLVGQGMGSVSGLASGIDTCVHRTTLDEKGLTVGVLGNGLGHVYPRQNARLQGEMAEKAVLVSEFPYNTEPNATHFPRRNRIISGLSKGVLVIEAGDKSGALITARFAAEQGKDVFAVPGSIFQTGSIGCHRLIKEGAKLVQNAGDILEEWGQHPLAEGHKQPTVPQGLTEMQRQIFNLLKEGPLDINVLVQKTQTPVSELMDQLLDLEFKGVVRRLPGSHYVNEDH